MTMWMPLHCFFAFNSAELSFSVWMLLLVRSFLVVLAALALKHRIKFTLETFKV